MLRRQRGVVNPHIINLPLESILPAAARADSQRVPRLKILIHVVQMDRELLWFTIDVDFDPLGSTRSVVGHHHMLPAVERQPVNRLDSRSIIQPPQNQIGLNFPVLQIQPLARLLLDVFRTRDDRPVGSRIDHGHREKAS